MSRVIVLLWREEDEEEEKKQETQWPRELSCYVSASCASNTYSSRRQNYVFTCRQSEVVNVKDMHLIIILNLFFKFNLKTNMWKHCSR